jgi:hypothetical protein
MSMYLSSLFDKAEGESFMMKPTRATTTTTTPDFCERGVREVSEGTKH